MTASGTRRGNRGRTPVSTRRVAGAGVSIGGEVFGIVAQLALLWLGIEFWTEPDDDLNTLLLIIWCTIATVYLGLTIIGLNIVVRLQTPEVPATRSLLAHPVTRLLSTVLTFAATVLGLYEALLIIIALGQGQQEPLVITTAVWTMLLSWALFHWGFARIYYSRYHRAAEPPLLFPGTEAPKITDFVYFSFTNATTFAASDVQVTSSRMRWTVVWHTSFAFFFNALIIALSMNVISNGKLFAGLF